jgi:biotin carboxyl carrier protein
MYVNSPLTATVKEVLVAARDHIDGGDLLIVFE